jgi:nucleoside-diphosphate-sugar epimerase
VTTALVIGGTGPSGPFVVNGLIDRQFDVTICHTGQHELDETPSHVGHIHTDPFDERALAAALGDRRFDIVVAMYGRLRAVANVLVGRCDRLITIGGMPAYRGYMDAQRWWPRGLPIPTREDAVTSTDDDDAKSFRVARTEQLLFELHPSATHFRYPYVYGPRQLVPREWPIIRRILDRRPHIIVPDSGLLLYTYGYVENLAHAVLLAVDQPSVAAGEIFNAADATMLTLGQTVEVLARALGHEWEMVSVPWELAAPARPLVRQLVPSHRIVSVDKMHLLLGYRDAVPVPEALARTAHWLVDHPPSLDAEAKMPSPGPHDLSTRLPGRVRTA